MIRQHDSSREQNTTCECIKPLYPSHIPRCADFCGEHDRSMVLIMSQLAKRLLIKIGLPDWRLEAWTATLSIAAAAQRMYRALLLRAVSLAWKSCWAIHTQALSKSPAKQLVSSSQLSHLCQCLHKHWFMLLEWVNGCRSKLYNNMKNIDVAVCIRAMKGAVGRHQHEKSERM